MLNQKKKKNVLNQNSFLLVFNSQWIEWFCIVIVIREFNQTVKKKKKRKKKQATILFSLLEVKLHVEK